MNNSDYIPQCDGKFGERTNHFTGGKFGILLIAAVLSGVSLSAQESRTSRTDTVKSVILEQVTVTAQQREQHITDVSTAITAVGAGLLENTRTTNLEQLAALVPGLNVNVQTPHRPNLSIRGLTSDEVSPNAQPRVSVYYNNVSTSRASMALAELYDMERIEVLKGPQGTLFGRGAQIGAIHFISKKPVAGFGGYVSAGLGNYAAKEAEGAINLSTSDSKLLFRAAGIYSSHDGYVKNLSGGTLNGKNTFGGRASATYMSTDNLTVNFTLSYQKDDNPGTAFMSKRYPNSNGETDIFKYEASFDKGKEWFNKRDVFGATLNIKYTVSENSYLTGITSLYNNTVDHRWDGDGSIAPAIDMAEYDGIQQFSQELRYNFSLGDRLAGFAGASLWSENVTQKYRFAPDEQYMAYLILQNPDYMINGDGSIGFPMLSLPLDQQFGLLAGAPLPTSHQEESKAGAVNKAGDLFFDLTWKIVPKLSFTAGVRGTYEHFLTSNEAYMIGEIPSMLGKLYGSVPNFFFAQTPYVEIKKEFLSATYRANLKYDVNSSSNVYAGYARGRRPNVLQFNSAGESEVMNAENVHSFDVGYKWFSGKRFQFDIDVFYQLYNNFQTSKWDGVKYLPADAGKATSYGVELTAKAAPTDFIEIFGNYAYIHARFDDEDSNGAHQEYAGNVFRLTPENSFSLGLNLSTKLSRDFDLTFTPVYSWKSHIWFEDSNAKSPADMTLARLEQDAYGLLNANLSVKYRPAGITLAVFANNMLDEKYLVGAGNTGMLFGVPTYVPGAPKLFGTRLKWSF